MQASPHPTDLVLGQRLRRRRILLGLSQEQVGRLLGVSYQQVQKYERGINRVGSSRLHELARILEVPVSYFFAELPKATASGLAETGTGFVFAAPPARPAAKGRNLGDAIEPRDTLELVRAFNRIADRQVRRRLVELARSLATLAYQGDPRDRRDA